MAKISIQCRFDLVPPRKDGGSEFLQIGAASAEGWRTVAQKSGALRGKDILEMINRIADRDGIHDRPYVCSESFLITPAAHSIRGIVLVISGRGTAAEFNASSIAVPS
jgi:hypothetical protein